MTVAARDSRRQEYYSRINTGIRGLSYRDLETVDVLVSQLAKKGEEAHGRTDIWEPQPLTEAELRMKLDEGIAALERGETYTLEEVIAEIDKEFEL